MTMTVTPEVTTYRWSSSDEADASRLKTPPPER